jgi:hypothetical protein
LRAQRGNPSSCRIAAIGDKKHGLPRRQHLSMTHQLTRHCERSAAIHLRAVLPQQAIKSMDCHVVNTSQ